jgi:hypothetical protein
MVPASKRQIRLVARLSLGGGHIVCLWMHRLVWRV